MLQKGSKGPLVANLQKFLAQRGFNPGPVDGIFGTNTDATVKNFQKARGLLVDGIVGPRTWLSLCGSQQTRANVTAVPPSSTLLPSTNVNPSTTTPTAKGPSTTTPTAKGPSTTTPTAKGPSTTTPTAKGPSTTTPTAKGPSTTTPTAKGPSTTTLPGCNPNSQMLQKGSKGPLVANLQKFLAQRGFNPGPVDGIFGTNTDASVKNFQKARGLLVDGIVGPRTWLSLCGSQQTSAPKISPSTTATKSRAIGIDVSEHDGTIDWQKVINWHNKEGKKIEFIFVRAAYAATKGKCITCVGPDKFFSSNWQQVGSTGLPRGAYHFYTTGADPIVQAKKFLNTIGPLGPKDKLVMDAESGSIDYLKPDKTIGIFDLDKQKLSPQNQSTIVKNIKLWLDYVTKQTGKIPIIYTSARLWTHLGGGPNGPAGFSQYPLWIAHYGFTNGKTGTSFEQVPQPAEPPVKIPGDFGKWTFWQTRLVPAGTIVGIKTPVDYDLFNGNSSALQAFFQK